LITTYLRNLILNLMVLVLALAALLLRAATQWAWT
jgi:hypothetical protein